MNDYPQIVSKMKSTPWLITEDALQMIVEIVNRRIQGETLSHEEIQSRLQGANKRTSRAEAGGGVGILPLNGPIFPKANMMTEMSGATSLERWRSDFRALLDNDLVKTIVLDIDSPGGLTDMVDETATMIYEARSQKPIIAVANTTAASAALYLATQADEFYVTPSGRVGSIGVFMVHDDISGALDKAGVKTTYISAGKYKTEIAAEKPLSDEAKGYLQKLVNDTYRQFVGAVARGRGVDNDYVEENFGQGRMLTATDAKKVNLSDGVATLEEVLDAALSGRAVKGAKRGSKASIEEEHSEPGTEEPLEQDRGGKYKYDTNPDEIVDEEVNVMNEDQLRQMLTTLGIDVPEDQELTDEFVQSSVSTLATEIEPLREIKAETQARMSFREQFPEEAARMERLEAKERESDAKAFADTFKVFKDEKGRATSKGFSAEALETIEECHKKAATRQFTTGDLNELLTSLTTSAIVDYSETGGTRAAESTRVSGNDDPKIEFATLVAEIQENDKLDYNAAFTEARKRQPELFKAYNEAQRGVRS